MKRPSPQTLIVVSAVLPLAYLYGQFVYGFIIRQSLLPVTLFEESIFLIQVAKLFIILGVKRLRDAGYALALDVFSIEPFALPVIAVLNIVSGTGYLSSLAESIFQTWLASVALVFPAYSIYRTFHSMRHDGTLMSILPPVTGLAGSLVFFTGAVYSSASSGNGLAGLSSLMSSYAVKGATGSPFLINATFAVTLAAIYVSMTLYATGGGREWGPSRPDSVLALLAAVSLAVAGWAYLAFSLTSEVLLTFTIPTVLLSLATWWFGRES